MAAVAGQVPETLHNIRTIRAPGLETCMERRYDRRIGDSYAAMERTSFYDAVYSPCCFRMRSPPIWTPRRSPACWKRCAMRPRGRTVLSISHRVYESLGGRTVELLPQ